MHGFLVADKPAGVTSHSALDPIRAAVGTKVRVGHGGTLDPFATGVLLVLLGDGTRLMDSAAKLPKTYRATVRFGRQTETLDPEGEVVREADPGDAPPADLADAIAGFAGDIEQVPPAHSALKIDGRRAYRLARAGKAPRMAPRRVTIHRIVLFRERWPEAEIEVRCGAGTYVRSLARDIGEAVGLPAYLVALRRTAVGPFAAEAGLRPVPGLDRDTVRDALRPPADLARAAGLPEISLDGEATVRFLRGQSVPAAGAPSADRVAVFSAADGVLLGFGRPVDGPAVQPQRVLSSAQARYL